MPNQPAAGQVHITLYLPGELRDAVKVKAASENKSVSAVVREKLKEYVSERVCNTQSQALRDAAEDVEWCSAAALNPDRRFAREEIAASLNARAGRIERGEAHPAPTESPRVVGEA